MNIRKMHEDDIAAVVAIELQSPSAWDEASLSQELSRTHGQQFVLLYQDAVVAWSCLQIIGPEAELLKIAVSNDFRRRGLASFFWKKIHEELIESGVEEVFLEVRESNIAARYLYEKLGFSQVAKRMAYYNTPVDNALIFKLDVVYTGE